MCSEPCDTVAATATSAAPDAPDAIADPRAPPSTPRAPSTPRPSTPRAPSTPRTPSTPRSHSRGLLHRTRPQFHTPPSLSGTTGSPKARILRTPISPTALPRRKGSMVRQMAFSQGSPTIRAPKSLDFTSSLATSEPAQSKSSPGSPGLDIDKELSILFEDSISSWLPTSATPTRDKSSAGRKKDFSGKTLRNSRVKKRLMEATARGGSDPTQILESMAGLSFTCEEDDLEGDGSCSMDG